MHRRHFLATGLLGAAGLGRALAGAQAPALTLGFSLYGMRAIDPVRALETCAEVGYDAVEIPALADWPTDPARLDAAARRRLRERLRELHLSLPAVMENTPPDADDARHRAQLDRLRAAAQLGRDLSPDAVPVIETILGGRPGAWEQVRDLFARRLADWARLGERERVTVAVKPHRFQAMNRPEEALWLLERVGSPCVKLAYDWSHFEGRDLDMADTVRRLIPHSVFVHVKDTREENGRVSFVLPGQGRTDYAALLRLLRAANYRGCVCVEVSGQVHQQAGYDPVAAARQCYGHLAPAFRRAGIERGRAE